jgi:peptidoglycan hydrolase CwlO-like protein
MKMKILKKRDDTLTEAERDKLLESKKTVLSYSIVLVAVVLIFLIISILISKRSNSEIWSAKARIDQLQESSVALNDENTALKSENAVKDASIKSLTEQLAELQEQLDALDRQATESGKAAEAWKAKYDELLAEYQALCETYDVTPKL